MWVKWPCARQAASTSRRLMGSCKGSPIVSVGSPRGAMAIATVRERSGRFLPPRERRRVSTPDFLMISDIAAIPEIERGIEAHGIERVQPSARTHVRIFDNFTMWLSANLVLSTVVLGALATNVFALGFWDSVAAIIIFNVLGALPVAFFSTLGPKLGLRQMTISRFSFGWIGAKVMVLCNVAACIGWSAVNVIVG